MNAPHIKRMFGLLLVLTGCAGDLASDAPGDEHRGSGEHALVATEPVPEVEWRAAPACGEELPAGGAAHRVEREAGLRAWVAPDQRVLCVDSVRRFRSERAAGGPDWQAMTYTRVGHDAPPDPRAGEPSPQPMNHIDADQPKSASTGTSSRR